MKDPIQWIPKLGRLPKTLPRDKERLSFESQSIFYRFFLALLTRLRWAGFCCVVGMGSWFYAFYILIFGAPEEEANTMDGFLDWWLASRHLTGCHWSNLKDAENSRIDAMSSISRKESHFLQFQHPESVEECVFGLGADGRVARYQVSCGEDGMEVFQFSEAVGFCDNEEELAALLDQVVGNRLPSVSDGLATQKNDANHSGGLLV